MQGVSGASGAAPVFHRIMARLHSRSAPVWPAKPDAILTDRIDSRTGHRPAPGAPAQWLRDEFFITAPTAAMPGELTPSGLVKLEESTWGPWFRSPANERAAAFTLAEPVAASRHILSPRDGILCRLDPELPGGGRTLILKTDLLPGNARWASDTLSIHDNVAQLQPGQHRLQLTDLRTGATSEVGIRVSE